MNARGQYGHAARGRGSARVGNDANEARLASHLDKAWTALYQSLAVQVGELTPDPTSPSGYHYTTAAEYARLNPDPAKVAWWRASALPLIKRWVQYKHEQRSENRSLADEYIFQPKWGLWKGFLIELRSEAQRRGFLIGASPIVGVKLYHSVGDREDAVKQMALDWTALFQDLAVQAGELTRDPSSSSGYHYTTAAEFAALHLDPKKIAWWKSYAKPRIAEWTKFKSEQLGTDLTHGGGYVGWTERFKTDWDVYEGWMAKLEALKAEAVKQGFTLGVPTAQPLGTTVWADAAQVVQKGAGAVATGIGDVWSIAKWGVIGALAIGGVIALSSVASNLRSGHDPAEKYMELARARRRPRELPAPRRQLALPPGSMVMEGA